jgi:hypothetical protein
MQNWFKFKEIAGGQQKFISTPVHNLPCRRIPYLSTGNTMEEG